MQKTLVAIALFAVVGMASQAAVAGAPAKKDWGAIATGDEGKGYGWAVDYDSKEAAEKAAVTGCTSKGHKGCKIHEWFHGECGSVAVGAKGFKIGYGHAATRAGAEEAAVKACSSEPANSAMPKGACKVDVWACNNK